MSNYSLLSFILTDSDPLFQRCLVDVVRANPTLFAPEQKQQAQLSSNWSGLPVILDEVFTGLYRLGRRTAAAFLGVDADVAVNAKLLTGGLVPLCTTTASQAIFEAFSSPEKSDALLHGHSYTAHAVGCQVAVDTLRTMDAMEQDGFWGAYQARWQGQDVWSLWAPELVRTLSGMDSVEGIFALGTVLSISLRDVGGGGMSLSLFLPFSLSPSLSLRQMLNAIKAIHPPQPEVSSSTWPDTTYTPGS